MEKELRGMGGGKGFFGTCEGKGRNWPSNQDKKKRLILSVNWKISNYLYCQMTI